MTPIWTSLAVISVFFRPSSCAFRNNTALGSPSSQSTSLADHDSGTSSTSSGLGQYILSGFGGVSSTSTTSSSERISNSSYSVVTVRPTSSQSPQSFNASTTNLGANDTNLACQASSVSVDLARQAIDNNPANYDTQTFYYTDTYEGDISYGTADVYTTSDGLAHAHGNFTVTSTVPFSTTFVRTGLDPELKSNVTYPGDPDCTIDSSVCASLYTSYRSSLSIAPTAPIPYIWPIPTNSPHCYDPESLFVYSTFNASTLPCDITGNNVQLFYWAPPITSGSNESDIARSGIVTTVYRNVTMTSPSIYLSFDTLQANILVTGHENQYIPVGSQYTNPPIVSIDPSELSTLTKTISGKDMASVVDEIARGGPDYLSYVSALYLYYFDGGQNNYSAVPVNGANIASPDPLAYYLGGGWGETGPPGCNTGFSQPECGTIFDDAYSVQLAVPKEVRNIDPAWARCALPLFGVYDPPHVLTPAAAAAVPTPSSMPSVQPAHPASPIMTSLPQNTAGPGKVIPATAHAESTATDGLQLPSPAPAPAPAAPDSDPSVGAGAISSGQDPQGVGGVVPSPAKQGQGSGAGRNSGSGQNPGNAQGAGGNQGVGHNGGTGGSGTSGGSQGAGGSQEAGGSQGSGDGERAGSGQTSGGHESSGDSQGSDGGQGSGKPVGSNGNHDSQNSQSPGVGKGSGSDQNLSTGQPPGEAVNPGASIASILNGQGSNAQGDSSLEATGETSSGPGNAGEENSDPKNPGTGSAPGQKSPSQGGANSGSNNPVGNGQTFASTNQRARIAGDPIATIAGQVVNLSSSGGIVIGGDTYGPGESAVIGGTPISVGANNLFVGTGAGAYSVSLPTPATGTYASHGAITVGGTTIPFNSDREGIIVDGSLLSEGAVTTIAGIPVSYGASGLVIGTGAAASTVPVTDAMAAGAAAAAALTPIATVAGQVLSANPSDPDEIVLPDGQTLSAGGPAATVDGSRISVGPDGELIVAGSTATETIALPTHAAPFVMTASGAIFTGTDGAIIAAVETTINGRPEVLLEESGSIIATLTTGGAPVTEDGEVVSAGSEGLAVQSKGAEQDIASTIPYSSITVTASGNQDAKAAATTAPATSVSSGDNASGGAPPKATTTASSASRNYGLGLLSLLLLACGVTLR